MRRALAIVLGVACSLALPGAALAASPAPAAPDRTWGAGGTLTVEGFHAYDVATLADGRVLAAGARGSGDASRATIVRLDPSGAVDTSFGATGSGEVQVALPATAAGAIHHVELLPDGRIVFLAATGDPQERYYGGSDLVLGRLTAAGAPDGTFSGDGLLTLGLEELYVDELLVHAPSGRIAVTRRTGTGTTVHMFGADGRTDTGFGTNGRLYVVPLLWDLDTTRIWGSINVHGWGFRADGSIFGAASTQWSQETCTPKVCTHPGTPRQDHVYAFDVTGAPVTSFGADGHRSHDAPHSDSSFINLGDGPPGQVHGLPDGRTVVVSPGIGGGAEVARFLADGARDTSFSGDGRLLLPGTEPDWLEYEFPPMSSDVDDAGRVVVLVGDHVYRVLVDGTVDNGFDPSGAWTVETWSALETGPGGRIFLAGDRVRALVGGSGVGVVPRIWWTSPRGCGLTAKRACIRGAAPVTGRVTPVPARADRELYVTVSNECSGSRRVRIALADDGSFRVPVAALLKGRRDWSLQVRLAARGDHTDAATRELHVRSRLRPICVIHATPL